MKAFRRSHPILAGACLALSLVPAAFAIDSHDQFLLNLLYHRSQNESSSTATPSKRPRLYFWTGLELSRRLSLISQIAPVLRSNYCEIDQVRLGQEQISFEVFFTECLKRPRPFIVIHNGSQGIDLKSLSPFLFPVFDFFREGKFGGLVQQDADIVILEETFPASKKRTPWELLTQQGWPAALVARSTNVSNTRCENPLQAKFLKNASLSELLALYSEM